MDKKRAILCDGPAIPIKKKYDYWHDDSDCALSKLRMMCRQIPGCVIERLFEENFDSQDELYELLLEAMTTFRNEQERGYED